MSETIIVSSSTLSTLINNYIFPFIRSSTIPSNPYVSGTFNDFNCYNLNYSGSGGNTTTAGYYYTYEIALNTVYNLFNLQIIFADETFIIYSTENTNIYQTQTYSYFSNIAFDIYLQFSTEVYIPSIPGYCLQSTTVCAAICCCGNPFDSCCYDPCDCYDVPGLCFPEIPSSYTPDLLIPIALNTTINATFNNGSISYSYSYGIIKPSGDNIISYNVNINGNGIPVIYLYNLQITSLIINANSLTISNVPNPPDGYNISTYNNDINSFVSSILLPYLNSFLTGIVFEFVFLQ